MPPQELFSKDPYFGSRSYPRSFLYPLIRQGAFDWRSLLLDTHFEKRTRLLICHERQILIGTKHQLAI